MSTSAKQSIMLKEQLLCLRNKTSNCFMFKLYYASKKTQKADLPFHVLLAFLNFKMPNDSQFPNQYFPARVIMIL